MELYKLLVGTEIEKIHMADRGCLTAKYKTFTAQCNAHLMLDYISHTRRFALANIQNLASGWPSMNVTSSTLSASQVSALGKGRWQICQFRLWTQLSVSPAQSGHKLLGSYFSLFCKQEVR